MMNGPMIPTGGSPPSTTEPQPIVAPTQEERSAFDRIGVTGKRFKALIAKAKAGRFLDKLGLFEIGASNMVIDVENIDASIAQCDKIIERSSDDEIQVRMLELKTKLQEQRIKLTEMHLKAKPPASKAPESPNFNLLPASGKDIFIAIKDAKELEKQASSE